MRQRDDLVRDLGEAAADEPEHAATSTRRSRAGCQEMSATPSPSRAMTRLSSSRGSIAERGLRADRADQAADEHALFQLRQALMVVPGLGEPDRAFVAEGDRQRLHRMSTARHRGVLVGLGEPVDSRPMARRSRTNTACAALICSMTPVSSTSCVVGPKCRYSP